MFEKLKRLLLLVFIAVVVTVPISYFVVDWDRSQSNTDAASYLKNLEQKALSGDANAMFRMGNNYYNGYGILDIDYIEALKWYKKSANLGYTEAMNAIGLMYDRGDGVEQSYEKALSSYDKAASLGDEYAQINLGHIYAQGTHVKRNYEKAFELYLRAAEQGNAQAFYKVGYHYHYGKGVDEDSEKAVFWFLKAANKGYMASQHAMGLAYFNGEGVDEDLKKGCEWFEKAAKQGDMDSQYTIAKCYFQGPDLFKKDYNKSGYWYNLASKSGHKSAKKFLDESDAYCEKGREPKEDSVPYCLVAANAGYVNSQLMVANFYHKGAFLKQDYVEASEWFLKAAKQGSIRGQTMISTMYGKGLGVEKDSVEQYAWWYVAAHSIPNNEIDPKFIMLAKIGLIALEAKIEHDPMLEAKKRGKEYLVKYGKQS